MFGGFYILQYGKKNTSNRFCQPDFLMLVNLLDADLAAQNGKENDFFKALNTVNTIKHVLIVFDNGIASGCGAIKAYDNETMEIKRMFTLLAKRGEMNSW
jgi:putative acetyltransferase